MGSSEGAGVGSSEGAGVGSTTSTSLVDSDEQQVTDLILQSALIQVVVAELFTRLQGDGAVHLGNQ